MKYAEKPMSENADFNKNDAHNPRPLTVPISGPYVRSKNTYEPPLEGMPEASSDFEIAPGNTTEAARRKANHMPGPIISAANDGVTKIPGSMADKEMTTTPARPMVRVRVTFNSSETVFMSLEATP